jgi:hypothetical protein
MGNGNTAQDKRVPRGQSMHIISNTHTIHGRSVGNTARAGSNNCGEGSKNRSFL